MVAGPSDKAPFKQVQDGLLGLHADSQRPSSCGAPHTNWRQALVYRCRLEGTMRVSGTETNGEFS
jgi:hypothetical protein